MFKRISGILQICAAAALMLVPQTSQGAESRRQQFILGDNTERIFIQGVRPMGMGGAFIAVADDENAIFYNPAGLARINYWRFTFPDYCVGTDAKSFDNLIYLFGHAGDFSSLMSGDMSPEVIEAVDQLSHTRMHFYSDTNVKYIQPGFGFGAWLYNDGLLETGAILLPEANWNLRAGLMETLSWGFGWDIPMFGYLATGFTIKATQMVRSFAENQNVADFDDFELTPLWGGGFDLGVLYQPTKEVTFALVCADLYTRMLDEVMIPNLKIGFGYKPWWLNFEDLGSTLAIDVVELNWQGDNEFKNSPNNAAAINFSKFRVGVEFLLSGLIALRGGMHQGYPTAGVSLVTSFININWAYYGRELGTYPGQSPEWNQRISMDWHTGALVAPPATPTPTMTPTMAATPTVTPTPTQRPTAQPTLSGKIPKLRGEFIGFKGTLTIVPRIADDLGEVESWSMEIMDKRGTVLQSYKGRGAPERSYVWNGKYRQKRVSSKDQYPWTLTMQTAGGTKSVQGTLVIVDTIPKLYTSKNYEIYPDKVYFSIKEPVKNTKSWKLDIFDAANRMIRTYQTQEELFKAFAWDAKDGEGAVVPNNANYRYDLTYNDEQDNQVLVSDKLRPVLGQVYPNENRTTIKVGGILFDTGKAYLTADMFDKVIKSAYLCLDEPNSEVTLEGHTDSTGSKKLNMRLSLVRAESVRRFLVDQQNVPDYMLSIKGWGPTQPIATNRTAAGREKNRRVEVIIRIPQ
ncbi:OmpA family protein [candidate division FCPU426 bacterium]|nr:OmpA family protein [candidate division FCPU426 bacterium]